MAFPSQTLQRQNNGHGFRHNGWNYRDPERYYQPSRKNVDHDAECRCLGTLLNPGPKQAECFDIAEGLDLSSAFDSLKWKMLFDAAQQCRSEGLAVTPINVMKRLAADKASFEVTSVQGDYSEALADRGTTDSFQEAAQYLADLRDSRRIEAAALAIADAAVNLSEDLDTLAAKLGLEDVSNGGKDRFTVLSAKELAATVYALDYLIAGWLVRGQNGIIAASKKSLKTTLAIFLMLRLAIGGPLFRDERFSHFTVPKPVRVCFVSGESGGAVIKETAERIAAAMGWSLENIENAFFCFDVPNLGDPVDLRAVEKFCKDRQIEVLILDPAYLMLPIGDEAGNLFRVGELLAELNRISQKLGLTTILVHHLKKGIADPTKPPELEDIAWAGFQEFARQWILIGRRTPYDPERGGYHELWVNIGGSAGHSALLALNIEEGTRQDPGGRRWEVTPLTPSEARYLSAEAAEANKDKAKERTRQATSSHDREAMLSALRKFPNGETKNCLKDLAGLSGTRAASTIALLLSEGAIIACKVDRGNRQKYDGYKLSTSHSDTLGQHHSDNLSDCDTTHSDNPPVGGVRVGVCVSGNPSGANLSEWQDINSAEFFPIEGQETAGDF